MAITTPPDVAGFTGPAPTRQSPLTFSARMDSYLGELQPNIDDQNALAAWMNTTALEVESLATGAVTDIEQAVTDGEAAIDVKIAEVDQIIADANTEIDAKVTDAEDAAAEAQASAAVAENAAGLTNYEGAYSAIVTYTQGQIVSDIEGVFYISVVDSNTGNALDNTGFWLPTSGANTGERLTFTKSFALNERVDYVLDSESQTPIVSVTKEVATTGETNNKWDVSALEYEQDASDLAISTDIRFTDLGGGTYLVNEYVAAVTTQSGQIDTNFWTQLNTLTTSETLNNQSVFYALSNDNRDSWSIGSSSMGQRDIVRNNNGTWQINTHTTYGSQSWSDAAVNSEFGALSESMGTTAPSGFYLPSASYDNKSINVNAQEPSPKCVAFNTSGTKMFVVGISNKAVYQYTLSTAFDVSTATYDSVSFSLSAQGTSPQAVVFNGDGTKMFVVDNDAGDYVNQYSLSTGFDLSTASWSGLRFSLTSQSFTPFSLAFSSSGTKMFVLDQPTDSVYQYTLSTAFDVSTASYDSVSFSVTSQAGTPTSIAFNNTGSEMFVVGKAFDTVFKYNLSTNFDISTAVYSNVSFSVSAQSASPECVVFSELGNKMFIVGGSADTIYQYTTEGVYNINQMDSGQLELLTSADQLALGTELDLAVILHTDNASETPVFSGMTINYDANVRNQAAIEGTDYEWWSYGESDISIKALAANNLKGRVL